jgi:hypothetical protein
MALVYNKCIYQYNFKWLSIKMSAPASLPLGFADQVMDLEIKLEEE